MTTYNTGNPIGSTDPKDLYDNAENFDTATNSTGTWKDRLGVTRPTLAKLEDEYPQAKLYSDQARNARNDAENAANAAQEASGLARAGIKGVYNSINDGISATSDGDLFYVTDYDNNQLLLYKNDSGTAIDQGLIMPGVSRVDGIEESIARLKDRTENIKIYGERDGFISDLERTHQALNIYPEKIKKGSVIRNISFKTGSDPGIMSLWVITCKDGSPQKLAEGDKVKFKSLVLSTSHFQNDHNDWNANKIYDIDLTYIVEEDCYLCINAHPKTLAYTKKYAPGGVFTFTETAIQSFEELGNLRHDVSFQCRVTVDEENFTGFPGFPYDVYDSDGTTIQSNGANVLDFPIKQDAILDKVRLYTGSDDKGTLSIWALGKTGSPSKIQNDDVFYRKRSLKILGGPRPILEKNSKMTVDINQPVYAGEYLGFYVTDNVLRNSPESNYVNIIRGGAGQAYFKADNISRGFEPQIKFIMGENINNEKNILYHGAPMRQHSARRISKDDIYSLEENRVYNWQDTSGSMCHLSYIKDYGPVYHDNYINGMPALVCDDNNKNLRTMIGTPIIKPPYTFWAVAKANETSTDIAFFTTQIYYDAPLTECIWLSRNGKIGYRISGIDHLSTKDADTDAHLFILTCPENGEAALYLDGQMIATGGDSPIVPFYIVGSHSGSGHAGTMAFSEFHFVHGVKTDVEIQTLSDWSHKIYNTSKG